MLCQDERTEKRERTRMEEQNRFIEFETEDGEAVAFMVHAQTMLAGKNYLLVSDSDEDEADAYIMEEIVDEDDQKVYEMVEDEAKLEYSNLILEKQIEGHGEETELSDVIGKLEENGYETGEKDGKKHRNNTTKRE